MTSGLGYSSKKRFSKHMEEGKPEIVLFKSLKIQNLEQKISGSYGVVSNLIGFAGELWEKVSNKIEIKDIKGNESNSSVIYEESSSEFIILHKQSTNLSPKSKVISKSFGHCALRTPKLQIEDDIQPQITSIRNQSDLEMSYISPEDCGSHSLSPLDDCFDLKNSTNRFTPAKVFESISETEEITDPVPQDKIEIIPRKIYNYSINIQNIEKKSKVNQYNDIIGNIYSNSEFSSVKHTKSSNSVSFLGLPIFKTRHRSQNFENFYVKEIFEDKKEIFPNVLQPSNLETEPNDLNEPYSKSSIPESSLVNLYGLIPESILYQIPILTFEEYINALVNQKANHLGTGLWKTNSCLRVLKNCCGIRLADDDTRLCEQLINFSITKFSFQNSFHLILLLSTHKSVTKAERWPHQDEDWFEMGFTTDDIQKELLNSGTITLLHIFFLSTYFPDFFSDIVMARKCVAFDLYEIISALSEITMNFLRKKKLNKLIRCYGRGLEVVFFYFTGVILYWFKQLLKSKDCRPLFSLTVEKARSSMNEMVESAWKLYIDKKID
jgi:ELMO/CED-12 family